MKISNLGFLLWTIIAVSSGLAQGATDMTITINMYYTGMGDNAKKFAEEMESSGTAAAYYNAGVARESLGEYDKALINYNLALKNGNKSRKVANAIKRIESNRTLAMQNTVASRV